MARQFRSDDSSPWVHGFGTQKDGNLNVSSSISLPAAQANLNTVSSGQTAITISSASSFVNGDFVILAQQIGGSGGAWTGAWELNQIVSGGGTTSLTLAFPTTHSFETSGVSSGHLHQAWSRAIILEMNQYQNVSISAGGILNVPTAWNGEIGGIGGFFADTFTMTAGSLNAVALGYRQGFSSTAHGDAGGGGGEGWSGRSGAGGWTGEPVNQNSQSPAGGGKGEATPQTGGASWASYTGGGGGGGSGTFNNDESAGGGGGGGNLFGGGGGGSGTDGSGGGDVGGLGGLSNAVGGGDGGHPTNEGANRNGFNSSGSNNHTGRGGLGASGAGRNGGGGGGGANSPYTNTHLQRIFMGGGGGGGGRYAVPGHGDGGDGGRGGGIWFIFARTINLSGGSISVSGANGTAHGSHTRGGAGGGGAGGSILFKCVTGNFGSGLVTALGGSGGVSIRGGDGGQGSIGFIHADFATSVSGTTNPGLSTRQDLSLLGPRGGAFLLNML